MTIPLAKEQERNERSAEVRDRCPHQAVWVFDLQTAKVVRRRCEPCSSTASAGDPPQPVTIPVAARPCHARPMTVPSHVAVSPIPSLTTMLAKAGP